MENTLNTFSEYFLIAGMFLVVVGLLITSQGSAQIEESSFEDPQNGTIKYEYEVLGSRQLLGMIIVLLGAIVNGVGGVIGEWSLRNVKENDDISSKLRWSNITFLIIGLFLFSIGFYWAVTNEMQTFSEGDIAVQVPTHLAVEQVFGLFLLASGLIMSISAAYLAGRKGFLAFKRVKEIEETG